MTIPFDPDFDAPASVVQSSSAGIINGLTGRTAFIAGVITSVLLLGTLGFFVMLVVVF